MDTPSNTDYQHSDEIDPNQAEVTQTDASPADADEKMIMVSGISPATKEEEIMELFKSYHPEQCTLLKKGDGKCCIVTFSKASDAQKVVEENRFLTIGKADITVTIKAEYIRRVPQANLRVTNVDRRAGREDLYNLFSPFGKIISISLTNRGGAYSLSYVQFDTQENAEAAIADLNGKEFFGQNIDVVVVKRRVPLGNDNALHLLYCKQFPRNFEESHLRQIFSEVCSVVAVSKIAHTNSYYCFVSVSSEVDANKAVETLNGKFFREDGCEMADEHSGVILRNDLNVTPPPTATGSYSTFQLVVAHHQTKQARVAALKAQKTKNFQFQILVRNLPEKINKMAIAKLFEKYKPFEMGPIMSTGHGSQITLNFTSSALVNQAINEMNQTPHFGTVLVVTNPRTKPKVGKNIGKRQGQHEMDAAAYHNMGMAAAFPNLQGMSAYQHGMGFFPNQGYMINSNPNMPRQNYPYGNGFQMSPEALEAEIVQYHSKNQGDMSELSEPHRRVLTNYFGNIFMKHVTEHFPEEDASRVVGVMLDVPLQYLYAAALDANTLHTTARGALDTLKPGRNA